MATNELLTAAELAKRWRGKITEGTLANWRAQGKGPRFVKMGGVILYPLDQVEKYENENLKKG